jgi:hypothetical protein
MSVGSAVTRGAWLVALTLVLPTTATAQWPPAEFTNLQVLPEDISLGELVATMRGFASGLGVRCNHCHVGTDPQDLSTFDFASDDKLAKRKARVMLQMVLHINDPHLGDLEERVTPAVEVRCATCHHGLVVPRDIRDILTTMARDSGASAALTEYWRLREDYYGTYAYDFAPRVLSSVANQIASQDPEGAILLLNANVELFPEFAFNHWSLGSIAEQQADTAAAISHFRDVVTLEPDNRFAVAKLNDLGAEP